MSRLETLVNTNFTLEITDDAFCPNFINIGCYGNVEIVTTDGLELIEDEIEVIVTSLGIERFTLPDGVTRRLLVIDRDRMITAFKKLYSEQL